MKSAGLLRALICATPFVASFCFAQADAPPPRFGSLASGVNGFVFCSSPARPAGLAKDQPVPVYVRLCNKRQVGTINCGEKVEVLSLHDDMVRIASPERPPHFVAASSISQQPDKFVAFDNQSGVPDRGAPDCSHFQAMEPVADGFVFCSNQADSVPAYFNLCKRASASIACGEKVGVISRNGDMLRVQANGFPRFVSASGISQRSDQMVPFGDDSAVPDRGAPDCSRSGSTLGTAGGLSHASQPDRDVTPPRVIYQPNPEFSEEARKKKIHGTVVLSLMVGADGLPHDIKVETGIGYGLDEKAVLSVSRWRFDPALRDGQPVEKQIHVEVDFHLY